MIVLLTEMNWIIVLFYIQDSVHKLEMVILNLFSSSFLAVWQSRSTIPNNFCISGRYKNLNR